MSALSGLQCYSIWMAHSTTCSECLVSGSKFAKIKSLCAIEWKNEVERFVLS